MIAERTIRTALYMRPKDIWWRLHSGAKYRLYQRAPDSWLQGLFPTQPQTDPGLPSGSFLLPTPSSEAGSGILLNRYTFLNQSQEFPQGIEWHVTNKPKLWRYNLHYFGYLLDLMACGEQGCEKGYQLIGDWVASNPVGKGIGWEPYPLAMRIVNWIKFLESQRHRKYPQHILESLERQVAFLAANLEPSGYNNHSLKSRKALLFAGAFFDNNWFEQGLSQFGQEVEEQALPDGGHYELSPMYHLIFLEDLLDCIMLLSAKEHPVPDVMRKPVPEVLSFAASLTHPDGSPGFFGDSADGIALPTADLLESAQHMGYQWKERVAFPDSGYYVVRDSVTDSRAIIDCGTLGPRHNPSHAHSDALSYELSVQGRKLIVNSGTHGYEAGEWRDYFRSTRAHNTAMVDGQEQAALWSSFRAANRIGAECLDFSKHLFYGCHNGYTRLPGKCTHRRRIVYSENCWEIQDHLDGEGHHRLSSFIHLHPDVALIRSEGAFRLQCGSIRAVLSVPEATDVQVVKGAIGPIQGWYSPQFGVKVPSYALRLEVKGECPLVSDYRLAILG